MSSSASSASGHMCVQLRASCRLIVFDIPICVCVYVCCITYFGEVLYHYWILLPCYIAFVHYYIGRCCASITPGRLMPILPLLIILEKYLIINTTSCSRKEKKIILNSSALTIVNMESVSKYFKTK